MSNAEKSRCEQDVKAAVVLDLVFAGSGVSVKKILDEHGVTTEEYAAWLGDDEFVSAVRDLSGRGAEAEMARVLRCLTHFAEEGSVPAAKAVDALLKDRSAHRSESGTDVMAVRAAFDRIDREVFGNGNE